MIYLRLVEQDSHPWGDAPNHHIVTVSFHYMFLIYFHQLTKFIIYLVKSSQHKVQTQMADQWTQSKRVAVTYHENGQAIGPNSSKFNKLLGTLARRPNVPTMTTSSWSSMTNECKDDAWSDNIV